MKPLNKHSSKQLLERVDNAANGELRSLTLIDPATIQLRLSLQDRSRGYDWIDLVFEIGGVRDAKLITDDTLSYVDMEEGITLLFEEDKVALGVGRYRSIASLGDSVCFIIGNGVKYAEAEFSG